MVLNKSRMGRRNVTTLYQSMNQYLAKWQKCLGMTCHTFVKPDFNWTHSMEKKG